IRALSPIPAVYRGFPLHPDDEQDPCAFRIDLSRFGIGTPKVVFSRDPGGVTAVHTDFVPLSLRRQPTTPKPRLWVTGAVGALAASAIAIAVQRRRATSPRGPGDRRPMTRAPGAWRRGAGHR